MCPSAGMGAPPRILCVDDEAPGLLLRRLLLESNGYSVDTATSGMEGLRKCAAEPFDALVLDFSMPGMDGGQVAAEIRTAGLRVPIIFLSAMPSLPEEVLRLADAFVPKGQSPVALLDVLSRLVRPGARKFPPMRQTRQHFSVVRSAKR